MKGYKAVKGSIAIYETEEDAEGDNSDWLVIDHQLYSKEW